MSDTRIIGELFVQVLEKYGLEMEKQEDGRWKVYNENSSCPVFGIFVDFKKAVMFALDVMQDIFDEFGEPA